jgi:hypothetical protein
MLEIQIISTSSSSHYLEFGLDSNEVSSFELQLWITKFGARAVDWVQSLSLGWISFMGGDVWVQNQPETIVGRATFFNEKKDFIVGIVANEQPNIIKILDSIGISTDGEWSIESITIPKTLNHPNGMYSKLPKSFFKKREGVLKAEFLRNMKTTSATESPLQLLSGEPLRGECAYLVLKNTSTSQVRLYKISINMTESKA